MGDNDHVTSEVEGEVTSIRPDILYHYTDAAGLVGIVQHEELWATDVQFVNDGEELLYAAREISTRIRARAEEIMPRSVELPTDDVAQFQADRLRAIADGAVSHANGKDAHVFVTCFCPPPDLLSQWRGYGRAGGFALGFDSAAINSAVTTAAKATNAISGGLLQVRYGAEALDELVDELYDLPGGGGGFPGAVGWVYAQMKVLPWLARVKNPAFIEEAEWRAVLNLTSLPGDLLFRTSGGLGVVPYIKIKLETAALREVVIGPGPHAHVRQVGVEKLLRSHRYDAAVRLSTIADSYRP